jgi:poly(3-hydroxybutyrate) depolymerase
MTSTVLRRASAVALALALALALGGSPALAKEPTEAKARTEVVAELAAFAAWCAQNGAKAEGAAALEEAVALDADAPAVAAARAALDAAPETPPAADAVAAQRKVVGPKVAKAYDALAASGPRESGAARRDRWTVAALRWEPSKPRIGKVARAADEAAKGARPDSAARLYAALRKHDPDGAARVDRVQAEQAGKDLALFGTADHPLLAWVSLPSGWQKGKTYPVLVGVEGAGANFVGYARASKAARGSRAAILVVPISFTNVNALKPETYPFYDPAVLSEHESRRMDFDAAGVDAVLALLRERFGAEEKVFLTGFSGGGNYCYRKLLCDPARVRGAAPACANYSGFGIAETPAPGEDGGPVVRLMTGANDEHKDHVFGQKPGIEGQTDAVEARLKELGYRNVTRVQLRCGHDPLHAEAWKLVDEVLARK